MKSLMIGLCLSLLASGLAQASEELALFKSPTCGCCVKWQENMESKGYTFQVHHPADLNSVKAIHGIEPKLASCHTAVSADGHVFEGHIPSRYIDQFLADPPEGAIGLSVPQMPAGSPGMEMGNRFQPYPVVLVMSDGQHKLYAAVRSPEDQ